MYKENGSQINNCSNRKQFYIGYKYYAYPVRVQNILMRTTICLDLKHFMKVAVVYFHGVQNFRILEIWQNIVWSINDCLWKKKKHR